MDWESRLSRLTAALLALATLPAAGQPGPADPAKVAGAWDLALDGSHRKCRITLSLEPGPTGHSLRFPAGCRRALPVLNMAGAWAMPAHGTVHLLDKRGEPALEFKEDGEDLIARLPSGEVYHLARQDKAAVQPASLREPPPPPLGVPQPTAIDPSRAPPFSSVPGTYVVDRYAEREVCRVALTATASANGRFEASLLEGCRDAGLRTFDPTAWHYEAGRLTLTARRGHEVTLISERDGHWRRDPEVGATLVLRKAP